MGLDSQKQIRNNEGIDMFSVIIPAYNAENFIKNAIDSVLSQTIEDFEIIVVNDGSNDSTENVVNEISDKRVRCISQKNAGVSAARNTGIQNAKGEYICFLDADDLWNPNHLEVVSQLINKYPETSVYLTGHEIILHNGQRIAKACPGVSVDMQSDNLFEHIWKYGYFLNTNSVVCKKSTFDIVGQFEVGVKNGEDDDMWYRLFSYFSVAISSEITTAYIRENSRATMSKIFVNDWIFLQRVDDIMASSDVSDEKKKYLHKLLEQRKLSYVRHCLLTGDKKTARKQMKQIDKKELKFKKYAETLLAFMVPSFVSAKAVNNRDKQYYNK